LCPLDSGCSTWIVLTLMKHWAFGGQHKKSNHFSTYKNNKDLNTTTRMTKLITGSFVWILAFQPLYEKRKEECSVCCFVSLDSLQQVSRKIGFGFDSHSKLRIWISLSENCEMDVVIRFLIFYSFFLYYKFHSLLPFGSIFYPPALHHFDCVVVLIWVLSFG